jgi:uncharacterized membrane protein
MEKKRAHLLLIQAIINRMSVGSFVLKGWSVLVVAALLAVAANASPRFAWLALFMAIAFWLLDAHFLRQVQLFRRLQERVRKLADTDLDYSLDTAPVDTETAAWSSVVFSRNPGLFHGTVVGLALVTRWIFVHG